MRRRTFVRGMSATVLSGLLPIKGLTIGSANLIHREIPKSGEKIPVIGMGSWLTFDVKGSDRGVQNMKKVLETFYREGGRVMDSSPMYGSSEEIIGKLAGDLGIRDKLWYSTKIWTNGKQQGLRQIQASRRYFGDIDVHHVHNIRDFEVHYASLSEAKSKGTLKYIGVTHYQNQAHARLEKLIKEYDLDFIQVNYNIENPGAANRLIPTAQDNGVAVIINRPYQTGRLFDMIRGKEVPAWAIEAGVKNWPEFFLKYIISNEGVTCAIPATTQVPHVIENLNAGRGFIPNEEMRKRMRKSFESLI